ncbi:hypothetical protein ACN9J5_01290 [Aliarcobacter butzleri]|uniref:hypothetical protein n=1 Tax=Aliarcobacter butzleri TaxID=28197 RepID=UPI002B242033|nr:hypothetical protein [Aliarcobacter butzleri]
MVKEYDEVIKIVQNKLSQIGFFLEENNEYNAIFGNGTSWKIELLGERYMRSAYDLFIKKIDTQNKEFCVRFLFDILGLQNNLPIEEDLNLLIENKDKIFDETFPYKEKYDELKKIPY